MCNSEKHVVGLAPYHNGKPAANGATQIHFKVTEVRRAVVKQDAAQGSQATTRRAKRRAATPSYFLISREATTP